MSAVLPLMKSIRSTLAKSVFRQLPQQRCSYGNSTYNIGQGMHDIMKIVKSLEITGLLIKSVS